MLEFLIQHTAAAWVMIPMCGLILLGAGFTAGVECAFIAIGKRFR